MADDDDCSFAPTFPSKVLGIKSRDGLFSCNSQTWAPMVPNMSALWFWGQINCLEGHYLNILFGRIMFDNGWWWRLLVCTYLPFQSSWNKVLGWAIFIQLTYMGTYGAKCARSLLMGRNLILFGTKSNKMRGPHVFYIAIIEIGNNKIVIQ